MTRTNSDKSRTNQDKERILVHMLDEARFGGWGAESMGRAVKAAGVSADMAKALFPGGASDLSAYLSAWADELMMETLAVRNVRPMRVRDRVAQAVWVRLAVLEPHKSAVQGAAAQWVKGRAGRGARALWRSADLIWDWAGDKSTDYNRYTKRGLLCGVMASTLVFWLADTSPGHARTQAFLEARIQNVLDFGRVGGPLIGRAVKWGAAMCGKAGDGQARKARAR